MKRYLVVLLCAIAVTSLADGQVSFSIKKYQELKAGGRLGDQAFQAYIMGLGTGFTVMNTRLESNGWSKVYCPPGKLSLTTESYLDLLDKELARSRLTPDMPIELVLLNGLARTFPCPETRR
jgi:hypothetical protein